MSETDTKDARGGRELFVLRAGGRLFAVPAEEVEATAEGLSPAPLPFAPPSVLGVVSVRGRVRTALDPLRLAPDAVTPNSHDAGGAPERMEASATRLFVALRGDEQLALSCDSTEGALRVARARIMPPADARPPALGTFEHAGSPVTLLDTSRLFEAAMQGTDRRRKRS
jgi:chemotaxis signal transduction protein